jgi:hypothetical protein
MPGNRWIEHVKDFANRTGKSYGCAVSDPDCKASYVKAPRASTAKPRTSRAPKPDKPMTRNYRKKVTPEQRERAKIVKQNILDRITY